MKRKKECVEYGSLENYGREDSQTESLIVLVQGAKIECKKFCVGDKNSY